MWEMRQLHPNSRQVAWLLALWHGLVSTDSRQWACTPKPSRASRCRASGLSLNPTPVQVSGSGSDCVDGAVVRKSTLPGELGVARRSASLVARCRSPRAAPVGVARRCSASLGRSRRHSQLGARGVARRARHRSARRISRRSCRRTLNFGLKPYTP